MRIPIYVYYHLYKKPWRTSITACCAPWPIDRMFLVIRSVGTLLRSYPRDVYKRQEFNQINRVFLFIDTDDWMMPRWLCFSNASATETLKSQEFRHFFTYMSFTFFIFYEVTKLPLFAWYVNFVVMCYILFQLVFFSLSCTLKLWNTVSCIL